MKSRISDKTREKRGLGKGDRESYASHIKRRDFSAHSRVHEIQGQKFARPYVLLSDLERKFFFHFDFSHQIKDIKEQFPLRPLEATQSIAADCQIKHPQNEKGEDVVMTTDFLVTVQQIDTEETIAVSIKPSSNLTRRTIEKMQIEKKYWNDQGIKWVLLTEKQINAIQNNNLSFFRDFFIIQEDYSEQILNALRTEVGKPEKTIKEFISEIAKVLKVTDGVCRRNFHHLLSRRKVCFDYTKSFNFNFPLTEIILIQNETSH